MSSDDIEFEDLKGKILLKIDIDSDNNIKIIQDDLV